jgi:hypothetical protein
LIARRRALGLDGFDEIWKGEYHMAPMAHPYHGYLYDQVARLLGPLVARAGFVSTAAFNLGSTDDFGVPDGGLHRSLPRTVYVPTAAAVVEIESPDDETWDKLDFYAEHGVEEVLVVTRSTRSVTWLGLSGRGYSRMAFSNLLGPETTRLATSLDWPPPD